MGRGHARVAAHGLAPLCGRGMPSVARLRAPPPQYGMETLPVATHYRTFTGLPPSRADS